MSAADHLSGQQFRTLYHGTPRKYVESIQQQGLKADQRLSGVYSTPHKRDAEGFGSHVIEFQAYPKEITHEEPGLVITGDIPPERIRAVHKSSVHSENYGDNW